MCHPLGIVFQCNVVKYQTLNHKYPSPYSLSLSCSISIIATFFPSAYVAFLILSMCVCVYAVKFNEYKYCLMPLTSNVSVSNCSNKRHLNAAWEKKKLLCAVQCVQNKIIATLIRQATTEANFGGVRERENADLKRNRICEWKSAWAIELYRSLCVGATLKMERSQNKKDEEENDE